MIPVLAHNNSQPLTSVIFYIDEKLKLGDQVIGLKEVKYRGSHLRNFPNQSYNLIQVQVIFGQDSYDIHNPFQFQKFRRQNFTLAIRS